MALAYSSQRAKDYYLKSDLNDLKQKNARPADDKKQAW